MVPNPPPAPSGGGSTLSIGAIAGIAAGGAALLVAATVLLFCWCRPSKRRQRRDSGLSKHASVEEGLGGLYELGGGGRPGSAGPPGKPPSHSQLADAQKLYAQSRKQDQFVTNSQLPYGSAFTNGAPPAGKGGAGMAGAAAAGAAAASLAAASAVGTHSHSRSASYVDEDSSAAVLGGSTQHMLSEDPLLEWILKTQSPPTAEGEQLARAASEAAVAAEQRALLSGSGNGIPRSTSEAGVGALVAPGTPSTPAGGRSGAASMAASGATSAITTVPGTPGSARRGNSGKAGLDVRVWQFDFRDLEIQKQIGEGSFGRVSVLRWAGWLCSVGGRGRLGSCVMLQVGRRSRRWLHCCSAAVPS